MSAISEMGVNIVETSDSDDEEEEKSPRKRSTRSTTASPARPSRPRRKRSTAPTTRSACTCARWARWSCSREGEIAIAKRIEAGRDTMIWGLCESPITFNAIIEWSNALNEGTMQLREILDLEAMLSKGPTAEQINESEEGGEGEGEISAAVAGPAFKEEEEPEEEAAPPTTKRTWSSGAPSRSPRRKTTTTPSPSPRWKRR